MNAFSARRSKNLFRGQNATTRSAVAGETDQSRATTIATTATITIRKKAILKLKMETKRNLIIVLIVRVRGALIVS